MNPRKEGNSGRRSIALLFLLPFSLMTAGCGSIPQSKYEAFHFPSNQAYITKVSRPFKPLGWVHSKVNFQSLDPNREEAALCKNYYNKAIGELVDIAKDKGADAVIDVKSVVFLEDGRRETYPTPECSDDGFEGQILVQGIAVQWEREPQKQISQSIFPKSPSDKKTQSRGDATKTQESPHS